MVREISVHQNDEVALAELKARNVGRSQPQLPWAFVQRYPIIAVLLHQLLGNQSGPIRRIVVHYYYLDVKLVFIRRLENQEGYDRQILFLIVSRQYYWVFIWHLFK